MVRGLIIGIAAGFMVSSWLHLLAIAGGVGLLRAIWCSARGFEKNAESAERFRGILGVEKSLSPRVFPFVEGLFVAGLALVSGSVTMWLIAP